VVATVIAAPSFPHHQNLYAQCQAVCIVIVSSCASSQVALQLALDEKVAFSVALDALKANAAKVEANFKQIRQELIAKQQQCGELQTERAELLRQLNNAAVAGKGMQPTLQQLELPPSAAGGAVVVSAAEPVAADVHLPSSCDSADVSRPQEPHENAVESSASGMQPPHPRVEAQDTHVGCERCLRTLTGDHQLIPKQLDELVTLRQSLEVRRAEQALTSSRLARFCFFGCYPALD